MGLGKALGDLAKLYGAWESFVGLSGAPPLYIYYHHHDLFQ